MTSDRKGVHEIANTKNPERVVDIVFIHGLGGSSHATWRYGNEGDADHFFWPNEIGKSRPQYGVWTFGYAAGFTHLDNPGICIELRAGNLARQLVLSGVGERPLIFVTHSMGGLVIKSLIVSSQLTADPQRKALVANIRGVIFCGTPHRGSDFARAAGKLGRYFGLIGAYAAGVVGWALCDWLGRMMGSQPHVQEMESNAVQLDLLHDHFLEWHRAHPNPIAIESYAETVGLFRQRFLARPLALDLVVPRASANPNIGIVHDVDADHLSLVKPPPAPHVIHTMVFVGVRQFIDSTICPPRPKLSKAVARGIWLWLESVIPSSS